MSQEDRLALACSPGRAVSRQQPLTTLPGRQAAREEVQVLLDLLRVQRELEFPLLSHVELLAVASTVSGGHVPLSTLCCSTNMQQ